MLKRIILCWRPCGLMSRLQGALWSVYLRMWARSSSSTAGRYARQHGDALAHAAGQVATWFGSSMLVSIFFVIFL